MITTVASDAPTAFCARYRKVKVPVKPVAGVKAMLPSAFTVSDPPVPNVAVVPAACAVTAPPRLPPPKLATTAGGIAAVSFARTPGAAISVCTSLIAARLSSTAFGAELSRTVIVAESRAEPLVARMRATPFDTAVTRPAADTFAMAPADVVHTTDGCAIAWPFASTPITMSCTVGRALVSVSVAGLTSRLTATCCTSTCAWPVSVPSAARTCAEPGASAVARPDGLTDTMSGAEEDQAN